MFRQTLLVVTFLSLFHSVLWGADKAPVFTQKDFAHQIFRQLFTNSVLPAEPVERDYLLFLGGRRTFRYEAELAYNELTDRVSIRNFPLFGAFTGSGWIMGGGDTTSSTFTIQLPITGEYELKGVFKGNGFIWKIDGKEYRSDSNSGHFKETDVAKVKLQSGVVTINLTIPPDGAIDSFLLVAPDITPIQPFAGWRFKERLTAVRMAEIAVALTNRYAELPDAPRETFPKQIAVAELIAIPPAAMATDVSYLGPFYSSSWIRADFRGVALQIPLAVAEEGYYGLTANVMGETISGKINDTPFKFAAKPFLSRVDLGLHRLQSGVNTLAITLPPSGGIDTIEFVKKSTNPGDFLRLTGVADPAERPIDATEAAALLKRIVTSPPGKK